MVWARIDDAILDNEKIIEAGILGFALHVAAITWCCRNLTDGFIPRRRASCLLDLSALPSEMLEAMGSHPKAHEDRFCDVLHDLGAPGADPVIERLVDSGLWTRDDAKDGYWLKDFLEYNPSREKVLAERARGADRKKGSRARLAPASGEADADSARSHAHASAPPRDGLGSASHGPDPDPDPDLRSPEPPKPPGVVGAREPTSPDRPLSLATIRSQGSLFVDTYRAAVESALGRPWSFPDKTRHALEQTIATHCRGADRANIENWLKREVLAFVAVSKSNATVWSSHSPDGFQRWLNAGKPGPSESASRPRADAPASPPYHEKFVPPPKLKPEELGKPPDWKPPPGAV